MAVDSGRLTETWGVGERFGLVDIGHGRTYWFATKNASEGEPDEPGGRKAEIRRRFSAWPSRSPRLSRPQTSARSCATTSTTSTRFRAGARVVLSYSGTPRT